MLRCELPGFCRHKRNIQVRSSQGQGVRQLKTCRRRRERPDGWLYGRPAAALIRDEKYIMDGIRLRQEWVGVFSVPVAWDQPQARCEGGRWSAGFREKGCKIEEYRIRFREGSLDADAGVYHRYR
ncbi:hypothetical protein TESG_08609 [Trichophyton tonsurans CBS 112818]|uniref:Uncharacterized protein n=1 Tax=Trichophyton tonsurans (strain CBS 112818) TaxID=647933 RepID=F2S7X4_TRIT1|nr:hypothetical protein TESG_08609 [Trichophyton tonsurans CBS 112818]